MTFLSDICVSCIHLLKIVFAVYGKYARVYIEVAVVCVCLRVGTVSPLEILTVAGPEEALVPSSDLVQGETQHIISYQ